MNADGLRFKEERARLIADVRLEGTVLCRAYSDLADAWLSRLLGGQDKVALVAVGGYGRRELCPGSDLDLLLVHQGLKDVKAVAERLWYPVWDAGVGLDHSVRTVKEAVAVAGEDLKAALGLLDARFVAGDPALAAGLVERVQERWRKRSGRWLAALSEEVEARHHAFGEVAFLLEPELKEGRGGLRDVHALQVAALASPVVDLPGTDGGADVLSEPKEVLLSVRAELHRRTGKTLDRLLLQEQDGVADQLGYPDADALMAAVAGAGRTIAWWSDDGWRRVRSALAGPRGRTSGVDRRVGPGLVVREGEVVLSADADPRNDASLVVRAAAAAAEHGAPLARSALERMAAEAIGPGNPWPAAARHALVALLGTGTAAISVLESLDQSGLLARLVPEWESVSSRPQRNAYHRFTVDRHLCEAAANAAALTRQVSRPDLLLVGAWLHDIGKGYQGDHTETGIEVVGRIAPRMGFSPDDVEVLVDMVRHHLLLADVATRRDLDDPVTVEAVASTVGDQQTLELLAALTEADGMATGPAAWGPWKARLVRDLVDRTARHLGGRRQPDSPSLPTPEHTALMDRGEVVVEVGDGRLTVVAPDRPGLFYRVAGTLALHGLTVRSAVAASEDGMAVEVFEVEPAFDTPADGDRLGNDIVRALDGQLPLEVKLAERARAYSGARRAASAHPAEARVLVDNEASGTATVIEVRAPDGVGVLYRITRALAKCDLDVRTAKVSTLGHEVVDAFYVTDARGSKVIDAEQLVEVERAVLTELERRH
ncbi:MAG: [protein-PII] uridylyltransferase [Actinomycetota bacterium]|nr:[protein-PII] uridylyltransferase [Actinomycetota bacterium]